ncbi:MAG: hypothetical protein IJ501_00220 [Bacilli bacterium]|nr:hypothetical protein [Bacilli bacterium]
MREAVGGSMLFYIILIFIFIYIVFIGLIMNYAATYRATNYVVTTIEETEGEVLHDALEDALKDRNYHNNLTVTCSENSDGAVYRVETYVAFEVPLMGIDLTLAITNDTKTIYGENCKQNPLS